MPTDPKSTYYDIGGLETVEIIRAKLSQEQFEGWCLGNIIKYACRAYHRGNTPRDIEKMVVYTKWLQKSNEKPNPSVHTHTRTPLGDASIG